MLFPGEISPGQLGPISIAPFCSTNWCALITSSVGIPSAIQTINRMPASAASIMVSAAKRAGTKMIEVLAFVCSTASYIVLNTGMPSTSVPPLPGEVPPTTWVPYSFIFLAWKSPSLPVIPCTIRRVDLSINMLIIALFINDLGTYYAFRAIRAASFIVVAIWKRL